MSESHLPACIKYTERTDRLCRGASATAELLGSLTLAVSAYELGAGLLDVVRLNMEAAEQHGVTGGISAISTLGLWAIGMVAVPRMRTAIGDRIHKRTDCAWDDDWQTDSGSGARPTT